jgi:hypothetical protein
MYSSEYRDMWSSWKAYTVQVLSMIRSFKCSDVSVATREFFSVVHTCGERKETEQAKGISANK